MKFRKSGYPNHKIPQLINHAINKWSVKVKTLPKLFDQTSLKLSVLLKNRRWKGGREKSIHINFQRIHDLFVVSLISSQPCIKTPSVSGSRNRRQVKPRNKNRHPNHFSLSLSLSLSCLLHFVQARHHRRNGFSQQYGKMFDDPIDHGPLSVLRGNVTPRVVMCVCVRARACRAGRDVWTLYNWRSSSRRNVHNVEIREIENDGKFPLDFLGLLSLRNLLEERKRVLERSLDRWFWENERRRILDLIWKRIEEFYILESVWGLELR